VAVPKIPDLTGKEIQSQGANGQQGNGEKHSAQITVVAGKQNTSAHADKETGGYSQEKGIAHRSNQV
jgi:hypothetical protein